MDASCSDLLSWYFINLLQVSSSGCQLQCVIILVSHQSLAGVQQWMPAAVIYYPGISSISCRCPAVDAGCSVSLSWYLINLLQVSSSGCRLQCFIILVSHQSLAGVQQWMPAAVFYYPGVSSISCRCPAVDAGCSVSLSWCLINLLQVSSSGCRLQCFIILVSHQSLAGVQQWMPAAVNMPVTGTVVSVLFVALVNSNLQPGGVAIDDVALYTGCSGGLGKISSLTVSVICFEHHTMLDE